MVSRSPSPWTLTQLAYAVAVDTHRHFERAARACNVSQPTLSMQLQKLEAALGEALFDRSRSPVVPTDIGRVLIAQARVVLGEAARLGDLRDAASGKFEGELRVGVIPTLAPYLLPAVLEALAQQHPRIELVVEEGVTEAVLDALRVDTLDVGLIATTTAVPGIVSRKLFQEPFIAYVGAAHRLAGRARLSVSDLSLDDVWLLADGHCFRTQVMNLCRQRGRSRASAPRGGSHVIASLARFESGNLETLKRLVERGAGMTLLPALAANELPTDAQRHLLIPFSAPVPGRTIRLVRRRQHVRAHLVGALARIVQQVAAVALSDGAGTGAESIPKARL
ncbi:MAG TPA: LysR substrate-binding domain-containing protein [Gemmatimonadaceae bacterium]